MKARAYPRCRRCGEPIRWGEGRTRRGYNEGKNLYHNECWNDELQERTNNAILAYWIFNPPVGEIHDSPSNTREIMERSRGGSSKVQKPDEIHS